MLRVLIAGRPNVGKSTLYNALAGRRLAITDSEAGTTRDFLEAEARLSPDGSGRGLAAGGHRELMVKLLDAGGLAAAPAGELAAAVRQQIQHALEAADAVLLVTDARCGISSEDQAAAELVRRSGKPCLLVANKCDSGRWDPEAAVFARLGCGEPVPVAAKSRRNLTALKERLYSLLAPLRPVADDGGGDKDAPEATEASVRSSRSGGGPMRLAVIGRRNAGKSTFVNSLAGYQRVLVSETPGTTRDAVEIEIERCGQRVCIVDTAGLVRRREGGSTVEFYSTVRVEDAIRRANIALLFVDCQVAIGRIERHAFRYAQELYKPLIFVVNKWDLATVSAEEYLEYLERKLPFAGSYPVAFVSAKRGDGLDDVLATARELFVAAGRTLATGRLNRLLHAFTTEHQVPMKGAREGRIYYVTMTGVRPPEFALFVNHRDVFGRDYQRYLARRLAEALGAPELPVKIVLKEHRKARARARR